MKTEKPLKSTSNKPKKPKLAPAKAMALKLVEDLLESRPGGFIFEEGAYHLDVEESDIRTSGYFKDIEYPNISGTWEIDDSLKLIELDLWSGGEGYIHTLAIKDQSYSTVKAAARPRTYTRHGPKLPVGWSGLHESKL